MSNFASVFGLMKNQINTHDFQCLKFHLSTWNSCWVVIGNKLRNLSSNPERGYLHFNWECLESISFLSTIIYFHRLALLNISIFGLDRRKSMKTIIEVVERKPKWLWAKRDSDWKKRNFKDVGKQAIST